MNIAERAWENPLGRKQIILSGVMLGLAWADAIITAFIVKNGYASEANPFLRGHVTESSFGTLKIIGTLLAMLVLWDIFRKYPRAGLFFSQIFVACYTLIVWWNVYLACRGILH